eukprot:887349-Prymnesium_polylepis.2
MGCVRGRRLTPSTWNDPSPSGHASSLQPLTVYVPGKPVLPLHGPMSANSPGIITLLPHS